MKKLYKKHFILALIFAISPIAKTNAISVMPLSLSTVYDAPNDVPGNFNFKVYPNPVTGNTVQISIPFTDKEYKNVVFTITNVIGQNLFTHSLKEEDFRNGQFTIDLEDLKLEKGIYLIKMSSGDHSSIQKLVLR